MRVGSAPTPVAFPAHIAEVRRGPVTSGCDRTRHHCCTVPGVIRGRIAGPTRDRGAGDRAPSAARVVNAGAQPDGVEDFDLHGLAGVRVVDAARRRRGSRGRQLGPLPRTLDREPDIIIRFVDAVELGSRLRYLGARRGGLDRRRLLCAAQPQGTGRRPPADGPHRRRRARSSASGGFRPSRS